MNPISAALLIKTLKRWEESILCKRVSEAHPNHGIFLKIIKESSTSNAAAESESDEEIDEDDLNNEAAQQEMEQIVQAVEVDVQEETELVPEDETLKDEGKQEKKMDIETDKYYNAMYYSPTFHIGKVKEVADQDLFKMEFLHAVSSSKWDWPKREDIVTKDSSHSVV